MKPGEEGFFSRAFLVPKKSGGFRLVIDHSQLNTYLADVSFQMDTLKKVKEALHPGIWVTSLSLSDAYHHVPLREQDPTVRLRSRGRKEVHLHAAQVRIENSTIGIHKGGEADKEMGTPTSTSVFAIPVRLFKRQQPSTFLTKSLIVPRPGPPSERR